MIAVNNAFISMHAAQKTSTSQKDAFATLQKATNFDDFIKKTKTTLAAFYSDGMMQQEWFNAAVQRIKKDSPSISHDALKEKIKKNVTELLTTVRTNEIKDAIKKEVDKATQAVQAKAPSTEPTMSSQELQEKMAALEREAYYDATTGLINETGIQNILEKIRDDNPTFTHNQLTDAAYKKALQLLIDITKKTTLDQKTKNGLLEMILDAAEAYQTTASVEKKSVSGSPLQPPTLPALTELKENRSITDYSNDDVPKSFSSTLDQPSSTAKTDKLTIQSILNGALKEPYTAKANEVYNSGTTYADELTKQLTATLGARYDNKEEKRIETLKATIDNQHRFYKKYLERNK